MSQKLQVNTIGRIPPIVPLHKEQELMERELYGEDYGDRVTGRFRGHTEISSVDAKGITLRTDSYAVLEMWLETTLSWEILDEALKERKRSG